MSRKTTRAAMAATTLVVASLFGVVTSSAPASAVCATRWLGAGTDLADSEDERINGDCDADLRMYRGGTAQSYRGRYWTGSTWAYPTSGWHYRTYTSTGNVALLTNVVIGTHIRVQTASSNATAESRF